LDEGVINEESTEEIVESSIIDMSLGTYEIVARDPFGTLVTLQGDFFNIEAVWGGKADDVFYGSVVGDDFWGGDGDNIMYGYGGNDRIGTGGGNNIIYGGSGHDKLSPWDGDDIVFGGSGDDFLESWGGNDEFHGGEGCDGYIYLRPGTFTIMDFEACDLVYYPVNSHDSKFLETNISVVGDDIIIEFTSRKKSNGSSTIILRNAALNGVTVDESTIIYDWPHWDCDVYWNNGPHC
jgi:Ca2+-binding RTX toxin-like protein